MKDGDKTKERLLRDPTKVRRCIAEPERVELDRTTDQVAAREAHSLAEAIIESVREPLLVLDEGLKVISASPSFYDTFRVTPDQTIGNHIYDLGNRQWDIPALRKLLEDILPTNTKFDHYEVDHIFPAIGHKSMILNARRVYREGIGTQMILLAMEDTTDLKQTDAALRASETRYRGLFETARDGILILDAVTGQINDVNPFLADLLGYTQKELLGKRLWELGAFKDAKASRAAFAELQRKGYIHYEDLPLKTRDGREIGVEFVSNVHEVNRERVVQCNVRDITERKQAEKKVLILKQELEQRVMELETVNEGLKAFSYSLSHDLRMPLIAIGGFSRRLLEKHGGRLDKKGQQWLRIINKSSMQMEELISDLLVFFSSGSKTVERSRIRMDDMVREICNQLKGIHQDRAIRLNIKTLPDAKGDRTMIRQVWANLLDNAVKYSRRRNITVIEVAGRVEADQNVYYIKDNGIGFPMEHVHKLFEAFERLHPAEAFEGTGLGLAIVRRVIHRHGGKVWAESRVDEGATFSFSIPK
jgi:PAS domain S-box-containing protein